MKVLVGLSGGVDSSTAAFILKQKGYSVTGVTMSIWGKDVSHNVSGHKNACYGPDEADDIKEAEKIAKELDIPYYVLDCKDIYEDIVLKNFKNEYSEGRTPNPCVWCNAYVKFGALPAVAKSMGLEFDKFATGHYARIEEKDGICFLKKGIDEKKDQSYFLYRLKQEQLKNIILPLGTYTKAEIREIAAKNGLSAAEKPDSQDFYGGDYNELLNLKEKEGNIVNTEGKILGKHKGIWNYTIGQRKGIGISSFEPLYVLSLNKDKNEVVVGNIDKTFKKALTAYSMNWIIKPEKNEVLIKAKIRSNQKPVNAVLKIIDDDIIEVIFEDFQKSIAAGQSVVLYDDDIILGGGIIKDSR